MHCEPDVVSCRHPRLPVVGGGYGSMFRLCAVQGVLHVPNFGTLSNSVVRPSVEHRLLACLLGKRAAQCDGFGRRRLAGRIFPIVSRTWPGHTGEVGYTIAPESVDDVSCRSCIVTNDALDATCGGALLTQKGARMQWRTNRQYSPLSDCCQQQTANPSLCALFHHKQPPLTASIQVTPLVA